MDSLEKQIETLKTERDAHHKAYLEAEDKLKAIEASVHRAIKLLAPKTAQPKPIKMKGLRAGTTRERIRDILVASGDVVTPVEVAAVIPKLSKYRAGIELANMAKSGQIARVGIGQYAALRPALKPNGALTAAVQ